jgi:hypothetical protein
MNSSWQRTQKLTVCQSTQEGGTEGIGHQGPSIWIFIIGFVVVGLLMRWWDRAPALLYTQDVLESTVLAHGFGRR